MISLTLRQCQFAEALGFLLVRAHGLNLRVKIQELNRDLETQKKYVAAGTSKTLNSRHIDKLAADIYIVQMGEPVYEGEPYRALGEYWESHGGRWGGRFHDEKANPYFNQDTQIGWDPYHFEFSL